MSKVIEVLETMACDANLNSQAAVEELLNNAEINAEINAEQSEAIITKDVTSLERQLDICPDIVCVFVPAEDDEPEQETEEGDEKSDENIKLAINS